MAKSIIGITGGIGAGKSVVSRLLRGRGYKVFDCDLEAKNLMNTLPELKNELRTICGGETYDENGYLNRAYLASLIFSDEEVRKRVNMAVHGSVRRKMQSEAEKEEGIFFVEAAIMASSGLAALCDEVWYVDAPEEIRFERALGRGGISSSDLKARIESQRNEYETLREVSEKVVEIDNTTGLSLTSQIDRLIQKLKSKQLKQ